MLPVLTDPLTVLRAEVVPDRYNDRSRMNRDWDAAVPKSVIGHVQPLGSTETTDNRDQVDTSIRVFLPAGTDVLATDRLAWNGQTYEVDAAPQRWPSPFGGEHHIELTARKVSG